jgi:hypothetical protein
VIKCHLILTNDLDIQYYAVYLLKIINVIKRIKWNTINYNIHMVKCPILCIKIHRAVNTEDSKCLYVIVINYVLKYYCF